MPLPAAQREPLKGKASFDFNKAVADARRDYPKQLENTTFVNLDAPDAQDQMTDWVIELTSAEIEFLIETNSLGELTPDSEGFTLSTFYGDRRLVATHGSHNPDLPFFSDEPVKQAAFAFFHELGHALVLGADVATNYSEQGADVFSMLRGISKGIFDKKDVKRAADERLLSYFDELDIHHLTTKALDAVVINPKNIDFVSLTPRQMARIASEHAEAFVNSGDAEDKILDATLASWTSKGRFNQLAKLALKDSSYSNEFYIAARVIKPLLDANVPTGIVAETTGIQPANGKR